MIQHLRAIPWIIFLLALGVRVLYIFQIDDSPLFNHPPVDGLTYLQHAAKLAAGNWLGSGEPPFWQPPLYPYLLGLHRVLFADQIFYSLRFFQIIIGSLTCVLIWFVGRRLFRHAPMVAAVAALAGALYGPLIFFDGEVLPATLATFLILAGLVLLLRCLDKPSAMRFGVPGVVFGLAALTVATVLTFVLAAAAFIWLHTRWQYALAQRIRWPLAFLVGVALVITPVTLRNVFIGGDDVLISSNAGINFWVGNNADYDDAVNIRPGWEWDDLLARPRMEAFLERPSAASNFFMWDSWKYISAQPLDYARLLARKTFLFWHGEEIGRNQNIYFWRNYSPILAITLWKNFVAFPFGLVGPLALLGLIVAVRRRGISLPVTFIIVYALSVVAFFIMARYRVPMIPLLLVYAAYGGHSVIQAVRNEPRLTAALHVGVLAILMTLSNHGVTAMDMAGNPLIHFNIGTAHTRNRDLAQARPAYERAVAQDSTYWEAWFNLGSNLAMQRDAAGASRIFERVTEALPDRVIAWVSLARTRRVQGDRAGALRAYESGLRADPIAFQYYGRYEELIDLYLEGGDRRDAARVLAVASRFYPDLARRLQSQYGARIRR
jgi:tetratricopeptide (TPR) repeat protein